jgi:hypothetical protein
MSDEKNFYFIVHPKGDRSRLKVIDLSPSNSHEKSDYALVNEKNFYDHLEAISYARNLAKKFKLEYDMFKSSYDDDKNEYHDLTDDEMDALSFTPSDEPRDKTFLFAMFMDKKTSVQVIDLSNACDYERDEFGPVNRRDFRDVNEAIAYTRALALKFGFKYNLFDSRYHECENEKELAVPGCAELLLDDDDIDYEER